MGAALAERLERLGLRTPRDLLFHLPHRYQDRTRITPMGAAHPGQDAMILGRIADIRLQYGRRRSLLVWIDDDSGAFTLRFFHFSAAQQHALGAGGWIRCYGEVRRGHTGLEMVHPEYRLYPHRPEGEITETTLTPVYPSTEGVSPAAMRKLVQQTLDQELPQLEECLPDAIRAVFDLMPLEQAVATIHRPPPEADTVALCAGTHPAQRRLAMEEMLAYHLAMRRLRNKHRAHGAPPLDTDAGSGARLTATLGFELTAAQQRVTGEILADLATSAPTLRLVQGDVGAGKTVVAALAALRAIDSGYQAALMAPTELLAEQHRKTMERWFTPLGIAVEWLTGKLPARTRKSAMERIATGEAAMVVGTHALFQQNVAFHRLGLLIIDEQHRFGVDQRLALRNKGLSGEHVPHQLIMSATPIPRSLAMIFYADLDVSAIDQLPPGRHPVRTVVLPDHRRDQIAARIEGVCAQRHQAYWVCPLIDESDKLQAQAAVETHHTLAQRLPQLTIELIHGRMKAAQKEDIMRRFHDGDIDLLVATTVIEVGVDVPAATLMIIENAERLGLAQLHQLRGRIGRGADAATCVLMYQPPLGNLARERLGIMRRTNDGFRIAQLDLKQRGPGELLGTRQTGIQQMKVADLARDHGLLQHIEPLAAALHAQCPEVADILIDRWINTRTGYAEV